MSKLERPCSSAIRCLVKRDRLFLHTDSLSCKDKSIRVIQELHVPAIEWNSVGCPGDPSVGCAEQGSSLNVRKCCCYYPTLTGVLEKAIFNGGEAGYRYADVVPGRATIGSSQDIGIANCPAAGGIDHEQLVDLWR